jgi:hypothetical protein
VTVDFGREAPSRGGRRAAKVPTFFGWTPGLRGVVRGHVLACGCLVGVYETRTGAILEVVDGCGPECTQAGHQLNTVLDEQT